MSRAHRLPTEGGVFHLTHRCHNRAFLLKFARDRNAYRVKLRDNYHATLVEEGIYLWRCLCYIELNMVRAGMVSLMSLVSPEQGAVGEVVT